MGNIRSTNNNQSLCRLIPELPKSNNTKSIDFFLKNSNKLDLSVRVNCISQRFLDIPYALDPLGEGPNATFDKDPLFRFDILDCMTFVEEVIALANSDNYEEFTSNLLSIRYYFGQISYLNRKHFVSADWLMGNRNFFMDVTNYLHPDPPKLTVEIDKKTWFKNKGIKCPKANEACFKEKVTMSYVPTESFFDPLLLEALPDVSIFILLRDQKAATNIGVLVAHMGFFIRSENGDIIVRHGTRKKDANRIIDEGIHEYLSRIDSTGKYSGMSIFIPTDAPKCSAKQSLTR